VRDLPQRWGAESTLSRGRSHRTAAGP